MLFAFIGEDGFAKNKRTAAFWDSALGEGHSKSERKIFFASEYDSNSEKSISEDIAEALAPSFFSTNSAVLVRHCELMLADDTKKLAEFIATGINGSLALEFAEIDKRSALYKKFKDLKAVEEFTPPTIYTLANWVAAHIKQEFQKNILPQTAQYIADAIGTDTERIHKEIQKIVIYNPATPEITLQLCQLFIPQDREMPAYELQESFGFRNIAAFLPKFRRILTEEGDAAFFSVLGALRSHTLRLLHIQSLKSKRVPDNEIVSKLFLPNQTFLYSKNRFPEQCSRWQPGTLKKTLLELDEISCAKKNGFYSDLPSFELAVCGLMV
ncbi:hypothetical protein AGMMS49938_08350 [Fibrobacterales bacterium]|nr:hypothetical protein AGMMS49938_08350 [Fibrobacterales bacterium]